jgi:hypothetical protein
MGAQRMDFGDNSHREFRVGGQSGGQTSQAPSDHDDVVTYHSVIPGEVNNEQSRTQNAPKGCKHPKEKFFLPQTEVDKDGPQPVQGMVDNQDNQQSVDKGVGMKHQSPVRLLLLGHQKKGCQKLDSQKEDKQKTRNTVEHPNKHRTTSFSGRYI